MSGPAIILESAGFMAPLTAFLGAAALGAAFVRRWSPRTRFVFAILAIALIYGAGRSLTWSARVDARGVSVTAPLSLAGSSAITWDEVVGVELRREGLHHRNRRTHIVLSGTGGEKVELPLSGLGEARIAPLVELVLERSNVSEAQSARVRANVRRAELDAADLPSVSMRRIEN